MRSVWMVSAVLLAGASLVFCGDDGPSKKSGSESEHKLKVSGLSEKEATGAELNVTVEITHDNKKVTEGDVASTKLSLHIKCGEHEVHKQENKAAEDGEVTFDPIPIEGDKFTGDCTLTVSGKIEGEDVKYEKNFKVSATANVTLPKASESDPLPTASSAVIVGRPFSFEVVESSKFLKVQPQSREGLCKGNLLLIYYDGTTVREVLTAGESIKPVDRVVSGLAVVKVTPDVNIAQSCKGENASLPPSIELTASPNLLKGMRLPVNEASGTPSLGNATLAKNAGGRLKLSWGTRSGFEGDAELFFNNATEGNEWTKHGSVTGDNGSVTSTLAYAAPVRVLIKVKTGESTPPHWLYFSEAN